MGFLRIAGAALNQTPLDWTNNLQNIRTALDAARAQKIELLLLPELCITGYGCEDLFLSQWFPLKAIDYLKEIIEFTEEITVSVGLPIRIDDQLFNCACLIRNQKILGIVPKQNLANDGVHYEPRWFTPWPAGKLIPYTLFGQEFYIGDQLIEVHDIKIGFEICEDAWRDTRPGPFLCNRGVDLILNPSASHFAFGKSRKREELIISSSKNYNCTYLYANLLGNEAGRMVYDGEIFIAQQGQMIQRNHRLSFNQVDLLAAEVDVQNRNFNAQIINDDFQDKETEFQRAGALALFDYLRKTRNNGYVISLSGGADSSCCAILVSEMISLGLHHLGHQGFLDKLKISLLDNIDANLESEQLKNEICRKLLTCVYQATHNSSHDTLESAKWLAEEIGAEFHQWQIDAEIAGYREKIEKAFDRKLTWDQDDITLQNIQARGRSPVIWMVANIKRSILITTSNRSEGDVGYATMDGDTSGSLAPIATVDKYFIQKWLVWAEKNLGYRSLSKVNKLKPSAELRPLEKSQTDEADLMPYKILVEIEKLAIGQYFSPLDVFNHLKEKQLEENELLKAHIKRFYQSWSFNQWKRERMAPAFHLDEFNIDPRTWYRFPIISGAFFHELKALDEI